MRGGLLEPDGCGVDNEVVAAHGESPVAGYRLPDPEFGR
jgi:hypothetical protein